MKLLKASKKSKGFTLIELLITITIIGILASIGLNTFTTAQKKSRDARRKGHLKQVKDSLEAYYNDQEQYPDDGTDSGNIYGCGIDAIEECIWGETEFSNTDTSTIYMIQMPGDPNTGMTYYYQSFDVSGNLTKFQLYARLENTKDKDVPTDDTTGDPQNYGVSCGAYNCNYGVSSTNMTPSEDRTLATE